MAGGGESLGHGWVFMGEGRGGGAQSKLGSLGGGAREVETPVAGGEVGESLGRWVGRKRGGEGGAEQTGEPWQADACCFRYGKSWRS